ncbi:MAG TPA: hypothetical protein VK471_02620 [Solirubrobacterales bacterium]|nr:hypothetical protein [Solirubrobacterales bacterium]
MQPGEATARGAFWRSATPLMLAAMLASGVLITTLASRISFLLDDWTFILYRRGFNADAFLKPDNEHFVAGPVAVFKLLLATFGMGSTLPYRVIATALFLLGAWFLFVWIRRRLGQWPALVAVLPVLFLGAAYDDLLWFASITFLGAMACGLGMLVALDRRDKVGDRLACAWLVGSMLFSSLWLAFAIGAAVDVVLRRGDRDWRRRAFVVAVPVALYAIWWLGWGHTAESAFSLHNVATTPLYVFDSFAAAIAALLGLATPVEGIASPAGLDWGRPLAVLLGALAVWRLYRIERIPRSLWVVLAIVLSYWVLGGFDVKSGRLAWASRYQYPAAAMVLLVAADLLRGVKLKRRLVIPALAVVVAAVASNLLFLHESYESYERTSRLERADLTAVEIARDTVEPGLILSEDIADTGYVPVEVGSYLSARDAFGSPAYTEVELEAAPEEARIPADKVLAAALRVELRPVAAPRGGTLRDCRTVGAASGEATVVTLPAGGALLRSGGGVSELSLGRFADAFPVQLGNLAPGSWNELAIPTDSSTRPWRAQLNSSGSLTVCSLSGGA